MRVGLTDHDTVKALDTFSKSTRERAKELAGMTNIPAGAQAAVWLLLIAELAGAISETVTVMASADD